MRLTHMRYTHIIHLISRTLVAKRNRLASLFNFDGALTKREQIPNEMGFGVLQVQMANREEVMSMRLVTASTTKAISHEDKAMTVIQYGSSVSAGNAKTRRHERRRKLAIERDAIGNIIDSILGCEAPDASQEESRKHASRVDRATSLVALRDKKPEVTERKRNPAYKKPVNHPTHLINAHQKMRGKSIPASYD